MQNISPIKKRILYFVDFLGISKREFYKKIGVSRGTLESNTGITEDIMAKFIAVYPEISPEWLLLGKEPMLRSDINQKAHNTGTTTATNSIQSDNCVCKDNKNQAENKEICQNCIEKEKIIQLQEKTISSQEKTIELQQDKIKMMDIEVLKIKKELSKVVVSSKSVYK